MTVGSTQFDELVAAAASVEVQEALRGRGFGRMTIQFGAGKAPFADEAEDAGRPLACSWYRYKPSLADDMRRAHLVVSHAGYGCLIEALSLRKPVVAVVNRRLMDDHQREIADHLQRHRYALQATPETLADAIATADFDAREMLPDAVPQKYAQFIDGIM